jgi:hypothetical protein
MLACKPMLERSTPNEVLVSLCCLCCPISIRSKVYHSLILRSRQCMRLATLGLFKNEIYPPQFWKLNDACVIESGVKVENQSLSFFPRGNHSLIHPPPENPSVFSLRVSTSCPYSFDYILYRRPFSLVPVTVCPPFIQAVLKRRVVEQAVLRLLRQYVQNKRCCIVGVRRDR